MAEPIDTTNKFGVCARGDKIALLFPPHGEMTKDEALTLAAWIEEMCFDDARWQEIRDAVANT